MIVILGKVGQSPVCNNLTDDVKKIKNALNRISNGDGGLKESPLDKKLDESNGAMNENTLQAIWDFQFRHFDWSGADRRIFPNGQTIAKINEILKDAPLEQPVEEFGKPAKTNLFSFRIAPTGISVNGEIHIWIDDHMNNHSAKYYVSNAFPSLEAYAPAERVLWRGKPISVDDFANAEFFYQTRAEAVAQMPQKTGDNPIDDINRRIYDGLTKINYTNTMGIKLVGQAWWNEFEMKNKIIETTAEVIMKNPLKEIAFAEKIIRGHLRKGQIN